LAASQTQWASPSKLSLEDVLFMLKLSSDQPSRKARPTIGQSRSTPARVWMTAPPSAEEWRRRNRSWAAELVYRDENVIAAKLMLAAGRERELVATYDGPTALLGIRPGERLGRSRPGVLDPIRLRFDGVARAGCEPEGSWRPCADLALAVCLDGIREHLDEAHAVLSSEVGRHVLSLSSIPARTCQ
jgi:hypothetical protein